MYKIDVEYKFYFMVRFDYFKHNMHNKACTRIQYFKNYIM